MSESLAAGADELATLRRVALDGGLAGETKLSCAGLADALSVSNQTASRRLQALESAGYVERDTVADGQWVRITEAGERALREEYEAYRRLFESPAEIELRGSVTGGMGEGRHYISLPGYQEQFAERLGYEPFAGTLNLDLDGESVRARAGLSAFSPIPIDGWEDDERTYGPAVCYPATVETPDGDRYEAAHVIAPERTHHDDDQLEVIAPEKLRDALGLDDGSVLLVTVEDDS
jgi:riboflavin kinase